MNFLKKEANLGETVRGKRITQRELRLVLQEELKVRGNGTDIDYILKNIDISIISGGSGLKLFFSSDISNQMILDDIKKIEYIINILISEVFKFNFLYLDIINPWEIKIKRTLRSF